ncbi:hypothetical protein IV203_005610 [Nitzschia inconspicua]|uniref:Fe2OG dioxygenase domain-containing protein n=1 Tax=Nitzschia inconspicua TaxID=303405 RepID=A0A9K3PG76_9STRA|nr:hypothetical protein IV203_005610 [Nitzschia inconspicua]
MKIINEEKYPWLAVRSTYSTAQNNGDSIRSFLSSNDAIEAINAANKQLMRTGAVYFPNFLTNDAIQNAVKELEQRENLAYTTDGVHTAYLRNVDHSQFSENSVYNHEMPTKVASTAFDELSSTSVLRVLYHDPRLLKLLSAIVGKTLYLSDDPLGCCSVNVFRPHYHHSFHFDESEFSVTLMLQTAEDPSSGLFQYTNPLRTHDNHDLALDATATALHLYDRKGLNGKELSENNMSFRNSGDSGSGHPSLHTLDFQPGTLLVLAGSKSLHRVTEIRGKRSRLVAVLTFASRPGFSNSAAVQTMFWGRSLRPRKDVQDQLEAPVVK